MNYKIINKIEPEDMIYMRKIVGWGKDITIDQFKKALDNTMCMVKIYDNNDIIAIGRLVGDYSCKGVLSDIIVNPKYQKKGYGKIIVTNLINQVYDMLNKNEYFQIEATPTSGNREFYVKCGMKYKPQNQDGVYIWLEK